jgi:hypothetical protein
MKTDKEIRDAVTSTIIQPKMRILHLALHRRWFDAIARGEKVEEYRALTEFWRVRLEGKAYDEIHFRNGYRTDAPWMRVQCLAIGRGEWQGQPCYVIALGKILEIRNYEADETPALASLENSHPQAKPAVPDAEANGEPEGVNQTRRLLCADFGSSV